MSQYDMNCLEKAGMLKMDFLGLTTLTVIHDALVSIKQRTGERLDLDALLDIGRTREGLSDAARRPHDRRVPVRVAARDGHAAQHALRPVRRPRGVERADAPGPARRGHASGLSAAQARRRAGDATRCPSSSRSSSRRTASSPIRSR